MSAPVLRVGLLGYGLAGRVFHAPLVAATPGLRLAVIVTADPERAARARAEHPGAEVVPDADTLWARADALDCVIVATPNRTHAPLAREAVRRSIPVVVDKPLAPTAAEARPLVAEARERGVLLTVFHNRRWDADILTLRRLLAEDALGTITRFESRFERWRPAPRGGWRESAPAEEGGGLLLDLGSHLVDQALLLFGPATRVYAELDVRRAGVAADDDAFVALEHASGVRSHLWMSALAAQPGPRLRVLGTRAAYVKRGLDPQEEMLRAGARADAPGWGEEPAAQWGALGAGDDVRLVRSEAGAWPAFYAGLVAALREEAPPPVDPDDAVAVLDVLDAARTSACERRVVTLGQRR